jgi:hypothetical protein
MKFSRNTTFLLCLIVFVVAFGGLALISWNHLKEPSPHFHFIDLAESFMHGRLDTITPHRQRGQKTLPEDPPGLQEAVDRQLSTGGWNDWVSYYVASLQTGETFRGVWPWARKKKGQSGFEWKDRFVLLSGDWAEFNRRKDIRNVCIEKPRVTRRSDEWVAYNTRDRHDLAMAACPDPESKAAAPLCDRQTEQRTGCLLKRYYVSFPPFPALLMMPLVAIWHYHLHDVLFTLFFAALNAMLLFLLFRRLQARGYTARPTRELLVLVFLYSFGTIACFSSVRGEVWFTALVIGATMNLLYLYFALDLKNPFLAGLFLACGVATRVPIAFAFVFFALQLFVQNKPWDRAGILLRLKQGALFAIPLLAAGAALMWYNYSRFGSPTEFGHRFLLDGTRPAIVDHGLFSFWFLPRNLAAAITNVPQFISTAPYVKITGHGLSLFATTPVFFYLLWPKKKHVVAETRKHFRISLHAMLWITVAATAIPGLFYQNTGWQQFGYRFAMDYLPALFLLLALDSRKHGKLFYALVAVSFAVNLFGAITFGRMPQFYH